MPILVSCSSCKARCRVPDELKGKSIQCPKCGARIRAAAASSEALRPEIPKARRPEPRSSTTPSARRRRPVEDDDEEEDERPRRRKRRRKRRSSLHPGVIVGGIAGVGVVGVLLAVWLFAGRSAPAPEIPPEQAAANPGGVARRPENPPRAIQLNPMVPVAPPGPKGKAPAIANPNVVAVEPFEHVVFSRTTARVVGLASTKLNAETKIAVFNIETRKKIADFRTDTNWDHFALSQDGTRVAGKGPFGKGITVLSKDGPQVVELPANHSLFFEFTSKSNLFLAYGAFGAGQQYAIVDTATNRKIATATGQDEEHGVHAIGPDRETYASIVSRNIVVRRFSDLQPVRQMPLAPRQAKTFFFSILGLAFSPDGAEVAAFLEDDEKSRLVCLNWQTGKVVCDHMFDQKMEAPFGLDNGTVPIEWLPDGTGWVLQGQFLVDKPSGKELMVLPSLPNEWGKGNKRFLDSRTQIVAKEAEGVTSLEMVVFDRDELEIAKKIVAAGGDPTASRLPPLMKTSLAGIEEQALPGDGLGWKIAVEAAREKMPKARFPVRAAIEHVEQLCVAPGHAAVVSLGAAKPGAVRNRVRVESFNLRTGGAGREIELFQAAAKVTPPDHLPMPQVVRFRADLAMNGGRLAMLEPAETTRVDVWTMPDGKHLAGIAPFADDAEPKVVWFGLVDDLLLTASSHRLVAWKIPDGKALYSLSAEFVPGSFTFSPGRDHLTVIAGQSVHSVNPRTGQVEGQLPLPDDVETPRFASVSFRPDGKAIAALVPELPAARLKRNVPLDDSAIRFPGPCRLIRWVLDAPNQPRSRAIPMTAGRVQWLGDDMILAGSQVLEWSTGANFGTMNLLGSRTRIAPQPFDSRLWFVADSGQSASRFACQTLPDRESVRIAKALRDNTATLVFGPGMPLNVVQEGSVSQVAFEQLKKSLEARKFMLQGGGVTLRIRVSETGAPAIKVRDGVRVFDVPGLAITGEATLSDARGELWKTSYKNSTNQGFGFINTKDVVGYFHKPIRDGAENWVRTLPLPQGIVRDGVRLIPYPNAITLVGD